MANQMTIEFEPGLTERFSSLREVMTHGIYHHGLKRVAMDLDKSPGNLSRMLAGEGGYHFSIELLERYIQTQNDLTPIYYLIARYLGNQAAAEAATMLEIRSMLADVVAKVGQIETAKRTSRR